MKPTVRSLTILLTSAALVGPTLAGCEVGPDFHAPTAPAVSGYAPMPNAPETAAAPVRAGQAQHFVDGLDVSGRWWTLYRSPVLDALVERALKANPDLQAAQAALRAARETYYAQKGALLPTAEAGYNVTRQQANGTLAPPLASSDNLYTLHTAQFTVSYAPDVFGGVRRQTETVQAQAEAQRFQTEAAYLTLTSNLVAAAIQEAMLREQIDATAAIIRSDRDVLDIMRRQLALGEIARADVAGQMTLLAQAEQTLPPLEKQLALERNLIANLTGGFPSESPDDGLRLSDLSLPRDLPLSLPSRLVEQRPDIRAAEANLHAARAQVGVAIADRLPNFTLTAEAGGAATNIARLFGGGNGFWSLAGNVVQPIFEGGALWRRQRAAEAAYAQAEAQYRSIVLAAFQNVADVLQALHSDARNLRAAAVAEQSAGESLKIVRRQYQLGEVDGVAVLIAEQNHQQAVVSRLQAQAGRYADTAALFQALGGGWWNRGETADAGGAP